MAARGASVRRVADPAFRSGDQVAVLRVFTRSRWKPAPAPGAAVRAVDIAPHLWQELETGRRGDLELL
jgi:hypothetical protein